MNKEAIKNEIEKALGLNSETDLVEFKDARGGFPKVPVRKTLSAFGNTKGGIIVFGVKEKTEDNKRMMKIMDDVDFSSLQEEMTNVSANEMNEVLRLDYYHIEIGDSIILAVYVPECQNNLKPYFFNQLGLPKGAYVRDGNTDRQMTEDEMKSYVRNAQVDDFDGNCSDNLIIDDLSSEKIKIFLERSSDKTNRDFDSEADYLNILKNIGIIKNCKGVLKPTIAGYLIFSNGNPQNNLQFERYVVRGVRYKGSGVHTDILDNADIVGTIDEQIDLMLSFILRNIPKEAKIIGAKREEKYEYPEKAIREIIANAVIHRDYRITETYTQVNIFEDRIEIYNPGNLPPGVTIDNIKNSQVSRNRIIAKRLGEMAYLEEFGRGIDITFNKMSEWGLLPPIFKNTSNSFRVILPGKKLSELNERQVGIWELLMEKQKVTRKDIESIMPDIPQQTISYDLRKMKEKKLITQEGQSSNTFYVASF